MWTKVDFQYNKNEYDLTFVMRKLSIRGIEHNDAEY